MTLRDVYGPYASEEIAWGSEEHGEVVDDYGLRSSRTRGVPKPDGRDG